MALGLGIDAVRTTQITALTAGAQNLFAMNRFCAVDRAGGAGGLGATGVRGEIYGPPAADHRWPFQEGPGRRTARAGSGITARTGQRPTARPSTASTATAATTTTRRPTKAGHWSKAWASGPSCRPTTPATPGT